MSDSDLTDEEVQYIRKNDLIGAIRSARERLGLDIVTAKNYVEREARKIGWLSTAEKLARAEEELRLRDAKRLAALDAIVAAARTWRFHRNEANEKLLVEAVDAVYGEGG